MTLRTRLLVSSVAVAVPLAIALFLLSERFRLGDMEQTLQRYVDGETSTDGVARCEAFPQDYGGGGRGGPPRRGGGPGGGGADQPPPGPRDPNRPRPPGGRPGGASGSGPYELFAYGADFAPADPRAPAMPEALRASLARGQAARTTYPTSEGRGIAIGVTFGSPASPCAFVMARMRPRPGVQRDQYIALALVVVSVLLASWISAGPVITRLRRLAERVHQSADSHYAHPVDVGPVRDEVADLAGAFNDAGARVRQHLLDVQARQDALRKYVADTTHDVAMPLTVLQGHLADLERFVPLDSPQRLQVRQAMEEAHYMSSLLRNLATSATLDDGAGAVTCSPVDVSALVERVVARHHAIARARGVALDHAVPEEPVVALTDLTLFEQAVSNLADNAVQYNHEGGHVALVLDRRGDGKFVLSVVDDGPGVSEEDLKALTTRQFRGSDARTRRPEGQGLGLTIVSEATTRLGFSLTFRRPPEGGFAAEIVGDAVRPPSPDAIRSSGMSSA